MRKDISQVNLVNRIPETLGAVIREPLALAGMGAILLFLGLLTSIRSDAVAVFLVALGGLGVGVGVCASRLRRDGEKHEKTRLLAVTAAAFVILGAGVAQIISTVPAAALLVVIGGLAAGVGVARFRRRQGRKPFANAGIRRTWTG